MRLRTTTVLLALLLPALQAASKPAQCKKRCDSNYDYCMSRAITKQAKKICKADHKTCRVTCK